MVEQKKNRIEFTATIDDLRSKNTLRRESAWSEVFGKVNPRLRRIALWKVGFRPDSEEYLDVAQMTWEVVAKKVAKGEVEDMDHLVALSSTIASRRGVDSVRKDQRRKDTVSLDFEGDEKDLLNNQLYQSELGVPDRYTEQTYSKDLVKLLLAGMPLGQLATLWNTAVEGLDHEDSARVLGKTEGSSRVALHRALKRARKRLAEVAIHEGTHDTEFPQKPEEQLAAVVQTVKEASQPKSNAGDLDPQALEALTSRQRQIFELIEGGGDFQQIADDLGIKLSTCKETYYKARTFYNRAIILSIIITEEDLVEEKKVDLDALQSEGTADESANVTQISAPDLSSEAKEEEESSDKSGNDSQSSSPDTLDLNSELPEGEETLDEADNDAPDAPEVPATEPKDKRRRRQKDDDDLMPLPDPPKVRQEKLDGAEASSRLITKAILPKKAVQYTEDDRAILQQLPEGERDVIAAVDRAEDLREIADLYEYGSVRDLNRKVAEIREKIIFLRNDQT